MEKRLDCSDIGMNCDYVVCTPKQKEVRRRVGGHIQRFHGTKQFSREFYEKAHTMVHEASCMEPKDCPGGVCEL